MIERFIRYDWSHYNIELVAKLPTSGRIGACIGDNSTGNALNERSKVDWHSLNQYHLSYYSFLASLLFSGHLWRVP